MCHTGSCFATNWMINTAVQPVLRRLAVVRSSVESDWLWGPREQMRRGGHGAGPKTSDCDSHLVLHQRNHFHTGDAGCSVSHRIAAACSSWHVISAFSSTLSTLIMQLNAALRIPAAAHPHYNTPPLSPTLYLSHTHRQTTECFSLFPFMTTFSTIHSQRQHSPPPSTRVLLQGNMTVAMLFFFPRDFARLDILKHFC